MSKADLIAVATKAGLNKKDAEEISCERLVYSNLEFEHYSIIAGSCFAYFKFSTTNWYISK